MALRVMVSVYPPFALNARWLGKALLVSRKYRLHPGQGAADARTEVLAVERQDAVVGRAQPRRIAPYEVLPRVQLGRDPQPLAPDVALAAGAGIR